MWGGGLFAFSATLDIGIGSLFFSVGKFIDCIRYMNQVQTR
jgi:hypothetical protein